MNILIVDDEPIAREGLVALFDDQPEFTVAGTARNGREAVRQIITHRPDLVLLDIQMPDMSGFDVLRTIEPERLPDVVFVTAFDEFALEAFRARAVDYILKPVDPVRLMETCARIAERRSTRPGGFNWASAFDAEQPGIFPAFAQRIAVRVGQKIRLVHS